jgi:hypothetical protein
VRRAPRALASDLGHDPRAARTAAPQVMPRYRITITGTDREAILDLVRKHNVQVFDHGNSYSDTTGYTVGAVAEPAEIAKLRGLGYSVEQHEDVDKLGRARQRDVGTGDRYRDAT